VNTLQINDIYETYYDGRERFPHLRELSEAERAERNRRRASRRERKQPAPKDEPSQASTN
jgi:hypothetical protein